MAEIAGGPVFALNDLLSLDPSLKQHVELLIDGHRSDFSAITIFSGQRRCIVHYHQHVPAAPAQQHRSRARSCAAHAPAPSSFVFRWGRIYKQELEEEAGWLGPVLLVPNEAARWALVAGLSTSEAADHFQVSAELMQFRLRMSGAQQIVSRRSKVN